MHKSSFQRYSNCCKNSIMIGVVWGEPVVIIVHWTRSEDNLRMASHCDIGHCPEPTFLWHNVGPPLWSPLLQLFEQFESWDWGLRPHWWSTGAGHCLVLCTGRWCTRFLCLKLNYSYRKFNLCRCSFYL